MKPFAAPLDDILFSLNHVAGAEDVQGWDAELAAQIGRHFADFAEGEIAPLDEPGDRQGCRLENGRVRMPVGFADTYQAYVEQGWPGLAAPEAYGGQGLDGLFPAVTSEIYAGANHSLQMVTGLVPGAVRTLVRFGTDAQKARYIPPLATGECLATMCLTEAGAGSDLSAVRCKAERDGDAWQITGEKIFISGGDQDMSDAILHLVLARTSDDGLRGLSLFLCPSVRADRVRNTIAVERIEEKMGLHASPTCHLVFNAAEAELIGDEGEGLKAMFTMMNHARLDVALQGVAHAARAYDIASTYAAERIQGRNADGSPARLVDHPDVRRMLDKIDRLTLGSRAIAHLAYVVQERGNDPDLLDFLTPVAKVCCTEAGIRAAETGMQILGGYGYLKEYRLEQTYRDARITAIYEGANGIHERMLVTRLLPSSAGDAFEAFVRSELEAVGGEANSECLRLWCAARDSVSRSDRSEFFAHEFMKLTIAVLLRCVWSRIDDAASIHQNPDRICRLARQVETSSRVSAQAHAALLQDNCLS